MMRRIIGKISGICLTALLSAAPAAYSQPKTDLPEPFRNEFELKVTKANFKISRDISFSLAPYAGEGGGYIIRGNTQIESIITDINGEGISIVSPDGTPRVVIIVRRDGDGKEDAPKPSEADSVIMEMYNINPKNVSGVIAEFFDYEGGFAYIPRRAGTALLESSSRDFYTTFFHLISEIKRIEACIEAGEGCPEGRTYCIPADVHYLGKEYKLNVKVKKEEHGYSMESSIKKFRLGSVNKVRIYLDSEFNIYKMHIDSALPLFNPDVNSLTYRNPKDEKN